MKSKESVIKNECGILHDTRPHIISKSRGYASIPLKSTMEAAQKTLIQRPDNPIFYARKTRRSLNMYQRYKVMKPKISPKISA